MSMPRSVHAALRNVSYNPALVDVTGRDIVNAMRAPADDPRLMAAAYELRDMILARYPDATFRFAYGNDPPGLYLLPTVDGEDTDEVFEVVLERLLAIQVDEELPVYVFPERPLARVLAEAAARGQD